MLRVENMESSRGNKIANQFIITIASGYVFQSYSSLIALQAEGSTYINEYYYKYSNTTSKYLSLFLNSNSKDIARDIKDGNILLVSEKKFNQLVKKYSK